ncbi:MULTISPECIES: sialate O-acetylesterase [unclassified Novosphingobium]|uniref:sialate O-acetylesterase n=1 Tax=unclassified Novosphingobium TaxID=2644732 RepID=UPI000D46D132|nr:MULTISPECIES: sialate O-acetylesterase [unclassified Novosphingobium]PTR13352.1 sialate O-acetylesterase [Novosphingobium sp. GV055]PUB07571.1 sialate O-acetylesterase [Novosphingobium sp. GV061]PUB23384.1 sialate O-acetylesterase [Novosphingobium sp. GV079]PUB45148.1 sialate O-acetylesterase [Novosphingobium sp. GV027]
MRPFRLAVPVVAAAFPLLSLPVAAQAAPFALAPVLTDNVVLQRGKPVPLRGMGEPGSVVHASLDGGALPDATVAADGTWQIALPAQAAGGGHRLRFATSTGQQTQLANVAFGDVFLCSGQSNMEFTLRHATNADVVIAGSANPDLRLFNVPKQSSLTPQPQFGAGVAWAPAGPASTPDFSAVCYFMGAGLQATRKVPVGLIAASWGGSIIEDWMSPAAVRQAGGHDDDLELLALRRRDPAAAEQAWGKQLRAFFARTAGKGAARSADVGKLWEDWGDPAYARFDGTATYTATVRLSAQQARAARALRLGVVDDIDQTLVNGVAVGAGVGWNTQRHYMLPAGSLHAGTNTITVNVLDTGSGGGLHGDSLPALELADGSIPIAGWQVVQGMPLARAGKIPMPPWIAASGLTTLYNGMIAPLGDIPLAGIAWYQGESNAGDAAGYRGLLRALIADWRSRFATRPFGIVQIAGYGPLVAGPTDAFWPRIREAQREVAASDPDAGLAVAIDVGDPDDIHPTRKKPVGQRLAQALAGKPVAALPVVLREGSDQVRLRFNRPLRVIGDAVPIGFELCDAAGHCRFAPAKLDAPDTVAIPVRTGDVTLRYLWADSPVANLFDADGSPLSPFTMPIP